MKTILVLSANPKGTSSLRLDREIRNIRGGLERSKNCEQYKIEQRGAVTFADLRRSLLDFKPTIVHFCGHGTGEQGLVLEDDDGKPHLISADALSGLFEMFANHVDCVLLNACYAEVQAKEIVQHINYVIGMQEAIRDDLAIAFAEGFYDGIGAGNSVEIAYRLGCNAIQSEVSRQQGLERKLVSVDSTDTSFLSTKIPVHLIPVLLKQSTTGAATTQPKLEVSSPPTPTDSPTNKPIDAFVARFNSKLTGRQRQDLEAERTGLQRRYDLLSQKIQRLGEALDIETDPATRFKLEIQLQQARTDRDPISREMVDVDSRLEK